MVVDPIKCSAVLYLKVDQVMLAAMVSNNELGYYSAAVRVSEVWYFLPMILSNAMFPAILSAKESSKEEYEKRLQQLCDIYFIISFSLAVFITLTSNTIVDIAYGSGIVLLRLFLKSTFGRGYSSF